MAAIVETPAPFSQGLTHSAEIGELAKALATARTQFKPVKKDTVNPFYKSKYADLSAVIDATEDALSKQGLAIIQSPRWDGNGRITVTTMLIHSSGQWMRDDLSLPVTKADPQGAGSAITYARRYSYQSFVNVAAEADDDANAASGKDTKQVADAVMPRPPKRESAPKPNGEESFKVRFWRTAKAKGKTDDCIREYIGSIGYEHTEEIPPAKQADALAWASGTL